MLKLRALHLIAWGLVARQGERRRKCSSLFVEEFATERRALGPEEVLVDDFGKSCDSEVLGVAGVHEFQHVREGLACACPGVADVLRAAEGVGGAGGFEASWRVGAVVHVGGLVRRVRIGAGSDLDAHPEGGLAEAVVEEARVEGAVGDWAREEVVRPALLERVEVRRRVVLRRVAGGSSVGVVVERAKVGAELLAEGVIEVVEGCGGQRRVTGVVPDVGVEVVFG